MAPAVWKTCGRSISSSPRVSCARKHQQPPRRRWERRHRRWAKNWSNCWTEPWKHHRSTKRSFHWVPSRGELRRALKVSRCDLEAFEQMIPDILWCICLRNTTYRCNHKSERSERHRKGLSPSFPLISNFGLSTWMGFPVGKSHITRVVWS